MKKLLLIILLFNSSIAVSQIPEITWQQCFGTDVDQNYTHAIELSSNGYLTGNYIRNWEEGVPDNFHGGSDIWFMNLDTLGNVLWDTCIGGSQYETLHKIININNNNYYLLGYSNSEDGDIQANCGEHGDLLLLEMDLSGNIISSECYGSPYFDEFRDAELTLDGGLVIMGRITGTGDDVSEHFGSYDIWLCKIDQWGAIEWEKTYGQTYIDNGMDLILTSNNTLIFIGGNDDNGGMVECYHYGYSFDVWLVEVNIASGEIIRQACFGGNHSDLGYRIIELEQGYAFVAVTDSKDGDVTGFHGTPGTLKSDIWLVRLDDDLNIIWQKCLGGYESETPYFLNKTDDNGFIVIGNTSSDDGDVSGNHGQKDIWVVKTDSVGSIQWQHCYGGANRERLWSINSVVQKSDNHFVLAAMANNTYSSSGDVSCNIHEGSQFDSWIFEIKDCTIYSPQTPQTPVGADSICSLFDTLSLFSTNPAQYAWDYEWQLLPDTAGQITSNGIEASIVWNTAFEGTAQLSTRSTNDCGTSEWSPTHSIYVSACLGVETYFIGEGYLKVYPNPAKDYIIFEFEGNHINSTIQIINIFGEEITSLSIKSEKTVWDCHKTQNGIYFYSFTINGLLKSGKILISR